MKKFLILVLTATLFSCGASKTLKSKEKTIKGNWVLSNISYSKTGDYKVTMFNDATKECLEGSTWKFVPNNNTGTYNITKSTCVAGEREFVFVIKEIDQTSGYYDFMLKPKNNEGNLGYRIDLRELTETSMLWRQKINIDGAPFLINMNFKKQ